MATNSDNTMIRVIGLVLLVGGAGSCSATGTLSGSKTGQWVDGFVM